MAWPGYPAYGYAGYMPAMVPPPPATTPGAWREYKTPEGKPYWSDGIQSVWEEPPAYREAREKATAAIAANAAAAAEAAAARAAARAALLPEAAREVAAPFVAAALNAAVDAIVAAGIEDGSIMSSH